MGVALEQALADWLRVVADQEGRAFVDSTLELELKRVLRSRELHPGERPLVARWWADGTSAWENAFLEHRVARALRVAQELAFAPGPPLVEARVIARRGGAAMNLDQAPRLGPGQVLVVLADAVEMGRWGRQGAGDGYAPERPEPSRSFLAAVKDARRIAVFDATEAFEQLPSIFQDGGSHDATATQQTLGDLAHNDSESLIGILLGKKYLLNKCLGVGGFGTVYEAHDLMLDKAVAVKLLNRPASGSRRDSRALREEARRVTRLSHPNIVEWKAFDETDDGSCYFVMELIEGDDLRTILDRDGPLGPRRTARILKQILSALQSAHESKDGEPILHLDLKPQNVFLVPGKLENHDDYVKVIDFGVGRVLHSEQPVATPVDGSTIAVADLTTAKSSLGPPRVQASACTPEYAAPELCAHLLKGPVPILDGRTDIYSVGVMGFEMLTGTLPIVSLPDRTELLDLKQHLELPSLTKLAPEVPRSLARFLDRCLTKDPRLRWSSAREAHDALTSIERRAKAKRAAWIAVPLLALLALLALGLSRAMARIQPQPLTLLEIVDGEVRPLEENRLYLGPDLSRRSLRVDGLPAEESVTAASLVLDRSEEAEPLEGATAAWRGEDRLDLQMHRLDRRFETSAYIRLDSPTGPWFSTPIHLVWLGEGAVDGETLRLPFGGGLPIDRVGGVVVIETRGAPSDVAEAWVSIGSERIPAQRRPPSKEADYVSFQVSLDRLCEGPGACEVEATVLDRAGGSGTVSRRISLVNEPLRVVEATLDQVSVAGNHALSEGRPTHLDLVLSSSADVGWNVVTSDGVSRASGSASRFSRGRLDLGDLSHILTGSSYSGWIDVSADDTRIVGRSSAERGRAAVRLPIKFIAGVPRMRAELLRTGTSVVIPGDGSFLYVADEGFSVRVQRVSEHALVVDAGLVGHSLGVDPIRRAPQEMVDPLITEAMFDFDAIAEGAFDLEVRAWASSGKTSPDSTPPDVVIRSTLVVDRTRPLLDLRMPDSPVRSVNPLSAPVLGIRLANRDPRRTEAPVQLQWRLHSVGIARRLLEQGTTTFFEEELELPLPMPGLERSGVADLDGEYVVEITGKDRAGNPIRRCDVPYVISAAGPEVFLAEPLPGFPWRMSSSGTLAVLLRARDQNGVASVRVELAGPVGSTPLDVPLSFREDSWKAEIDIPRGWEGEFVTLGVLARDAQGSETRYRTTVEVAPADSTLPAAIDVACAGEGATSMRLVRGNDGFPYVFGGRNDELENALFIEADLPAFDDTSLSRSWSVAYAESQIEDFYVDVREVTVRQFLSFARDRDAWASSDVSSLSEERRAGLVAELSGADPESPATGVTWDEARAYAAWVGKRLPSVVEWEYAVRGGARYRPYPGYAADSPRDGSTLDSDVTIDTGVSGLCASPAEWTATPVRFDDGDELSINVAAIVRDHAAEALTPSLFSAWCERPSYWAVGARDGRNRADFTALRSALRDRPDPRIGFRCALSAERVRLALQDGGRLDDRTSLSARNP